MRHVIVLGSLCLAFAGGAARAQALDAEPYPADARPRGLFAVTVTGMVAHSVGGALAKGLGGMVTRLFEPGKRPVARPLLELRAFDSTGASQRVDPASHVFRAGEKFELRYRASRSGRLRVLAVDGSGRESRVDETAVEAGKSTRLGPYRMGSVAGTQTLKLVLGPCEAGSA